jgi:GNAT superfamily N-acetyltransferase
MALAIVPFAEEHLDGAAELLAARHRGARVGAPALPARFERAKAMRAILEPTIRWPRTTAIAALRGGRVVGFLAGVVLLPRPTSRNARFLQPRCAFVAPTAHAAEPDDAGVLYREMYAAAAPAWIAAGCFWHYVSVPAADPRAVEAWHALGFGRDVTAALRDTAAPSMQSTEVEVRRAGPEDLDAVMRMALGLFHHHTAAPMYVPCLPEMEAEEWEYQRKLLADPACAHWLAHRGGRLLGMQSLQPPPSFLSPVFTPERSVYLLQGYTEPDARGTGVGGALLSRSFAWAREEGHGDCVLHFHSSNATAAGFWLGSGFRPVELRLARHVDERIAWAGPRP